MGAKLADTASYTAGDYLSVLGLFLTVIGFVATLYNVYRAKRAAQRAQEEVAKVRKDILRIDMVAEFSAALAAMEEIKRLHREGAWPVLPDRYAELRRTLISIKSAGSEMLDEHKTALQSSIQHFSSIERTVEKALSTEETPPDIPKLNSVVSRQIDHLQEVLTQVKNKIGA